MDIISSVNHFINGIVWGPFMLCVMLGVGLLYSFKLRFFQIRGFKKWWRATIISAVKADNKKSRKGISPFQAMAAALAGAVGTGNIVGVAGAITLGGPGAVFWMWIAALSGMATIYAENYLGVLFREKNKNGFSGGPMYYIEKGLGLKGLAAVFAVICTGAALGMGNMTQANSVAGSLKNGFSIPCIFSAPAIALLTAIIIFGGINRIATITEKLVPVMAGLYIAASLSVIILNINVLPSAIGKIISSAFDIRAAAGGIMGCGMAKAIKFGFSRGVFSNEAGLGTSPIVHAASESNDPHSAGMWGIFQVFTDTIVLCTLTALSILMTGADEISGDGIAVSAYAFSDTLGNTGKLFLSVSIVLFAFATLVSWCYYGESALSYLTGGRFIIIYRLLYSAAAFIGCIMNVDLVWEISDTLNGLMAIPNLIALIMLSRNVRLYKSDNRTKLHS